MNREELKRSDSVDEVNVIVLLHDAFTWIQPEQYKDIVSHSKENGFVIIPVSVKGLFK